MKTYVYGWKNIKNGMMNIGFKSPNGDDKLVYISSISSSEFWEEYSLGNMRESLLFVGDAAQEDTAKTLEWFALKYGTAIKPEMFYNAKNNAHCVDESLLTSEMKQVVIDYIEGNGNGLEIEDIFAEDKDIVTAISERIDAGQYQVFQEFVVDVDLFDRNQVREEELDLTHAIKIKNKLEENPEEARKGFGPIVVAVEEDGTRKIIDGNTRFYAAKKARGWNKVPVVYINASEFGFGDKRHKNYELFGLYENREDFVIKKPNTKADLIRNIKNFIVSEGLDLSKPLHVEHARSLIYDRYLIVCGSKQQLNGYLNSILVEFEKNQAELKFQKNLKRYDSAFFAAYSWNKYEKDDIATVCIAMSDTAHAKPLAYICRRMKNLKTEKGAIILHYTKKDQIISEQENDWIGDLKETINFLKLNITVEVLPAFDD